MALPAAIALGIGSLAINAWTAFQKKEISEDEYRRAISAANELEAQLKKLRPDDTWENIDPKLLQKAAEYVPNIAAFVEENAPQLVTEANSAAEKRIQRQALQSYAAQAETGRDVIADAQREQALFESDARAKQRQQMLMQRLKQQGMLGTGAGLAAQLQTEQAEQQAARQESLRGVQEAEMRRRQALGQAASLAGQMRQANVNVESANVNTMNEYNQRLANAKNMYNRYASGARNEAQLENQRREMDRERYNLGLTNQYALYNRQQQAAARERARQHDLYSVNKLFDVRGGTEQGRVQGERAFMGDMATAVTSGLGTGLSAYTGLEGLNQAKLANAAQSGLTSAQTAYYNALAQGALQGATQRAVAGSPDNYVMRNSQTGALFNQEIMPQFQVPQQAPGYSGPYAYSQGFDETSENFYNPDAIWNSNEFLNPPKKSRQLPSNQTYIPFKGK